LIRQIQRLLQELRKQIPALAVLVRVKMDV